MAWTWKNHEAALKVLLVRHGRTAWNAQRRFLGRTDVPLDEQGHRQAECLAGWLAGVSFERVYTSPLSRASHTAAYLSAQATAVDDLRELHQGDLEGLHSQEAVARFPEFFTAWVQGPAGVVVPGGESMDACQQRGLAALRWIREAHRLGTTVAAVTHQMVIASVLCAIEGHELNRWRDYTVRNTSVTVLNWTNGAWSIEARDLLAPDASVDGHE